MNARADFRQLAVALAMALPAPAPLIAQAVCSAPHSSPVLTSSGSLRTLAPGSGWVQLTLYRSQSERFFDADGTSQRLITDATALARAMTRKCALAGLNAGGAKGAFIDHPGITDRPAMLRALGRYIDSLGGRFYTSGDLGIGPDDIAYMRETSR